MSLLDVVENVCLRIGLEIPAAVVGSTEREHRELLRVANRAASDIAKAHDWQKLKFSTTITGDGVTKSFDFPADYDRMLKKAQLWSESLRTPFTPVTDTDEWLGMEVQLNEYVVNAWTIYGDQIHIKPEVATGVDVLYFYMSKNIIQPATGQRKTHFTADDDSFVLDEEMLEYGMIWRWKHDKGQAYAEDLETYEEFKAERITQDKGSRVQRMGHVRMPGDLRTSYPRSINGIPT